MFSPGKDADNIGCPNVSMMANAILLSGMRSPIVFFLFCKILGTSLLAGNTKVNGPGKVLFKIRNKELLILFA